MLADCFHACLSLCMINTHNVFLFFPFPFLQKLLSLLPLVLSQVQVSIHIHLQSMSGYFFGQSNFCIIAETQPVASGPQAWVWLWCLSSVLSLCDVSSLWVLCVVPDLVGGVQLLLHVVGFVSTLEALQPDQLYSAFTNRAVESLQGFMSSYLKTNYFSWVLHYYAIIIRQESIQCFHKGIIQGRLVLPLFLYSSRRSWSLKLSRQRTDFSCRPLFSDCSQFSCKHSSVTMGHCCESVFKSCFRLGAFLNDTKKSR